MHLKKQCAFKNVHLHDSAFENLSFPFENLSGQKLVSHFFLQNEMNLKNSVAISQKRTIINSLMSYIYALQTAMTCIA